jgi:hypothetical protein
MPDIEKLKDELIQVKGQLAMLQANSKKMHPIKQAMLVARINELFPRIIQAEGSAEGFMSDMGNGEQLDSDKNGLKE